LFAGSDDNECAHCHQKHKGPDNLIPNKALRTAVMNFENESGYMHVAVASNKIEADGQRHRTAQDVQLEKLRLRLDGLYFVFLFFSNILFHF
jgi:hypothetical protein